MCMHAWYSSTCEKFQANGVMAPSGIWPQTELLCNLTITSYYCCCYLSTKSFISKTNRLDLVDRPGKHSSCLLPLQERMRPTRASRPQRVTLSDSNDNRIQCNYRFLIFTRLPFVVRAYRNRRVHVINGFN